MHVLPALTLALSAGAAGAQQTTTPPARPQPARGAMQARMAAQPHARMARRGGQHAMMRRGGSPAERLLGLRTQLGLTSDQVARLQALEASPNGATASRSADRLRARADLMEATQKGDMNAAHAALDRIAKMRSDAEFAKLKTRHDVQAVLTADQKAKLKQFRGAARRGGGGQMRMRARGGRGTRPGGAPGFGGGPGFGG
jgi:hypothetical protein